MKEIVEIGDTAYMEAAGKNDGTVSRLVWNRFVRKNALIYIGTNVFFNTVIPYNSFENPDAVHLFQGTYCIARFLLPLAFFIPLLITIDTCNKTRDLFRKKATGFTFPAGFRYNKFVWRHALRNSCVTFLLTLSFMVTLQFSIPDQYTFKGIMVSVVMGIYAGAVALFFMKHTLERLRTEEIIKIASS